MKRSIPFISNHIEERSQILKENKVREVFAFGSIMTTKFNEDSDILLSIENGFAPVVYGDNYFKIIKKQEVLLNRREDVTTDKNLSNSSFIKTINKTKTPIYEG
jgi:hypothetical protein